METNRINSTVWEDLYSSGRSVLLYPDSVLVNLTHHLLKPDKHKKILDYGFGSGSNMLYLLKRGFEVKGVEVSENAMQITQERLKKCSMEADLRLMKDGIIPFDNSTFGCVLAWQVLCYNDWESLEWVLSEINRVLMDGGLFLAAMKAPGDCSHLNSIPLGDCVYQSKMPGQEGAIFLVLNESQLGRCFPVDSLKIGKFGYSFNNDESWHWIISYEKGN